MGVLTISFVHRVVNLGVVYKVDTTRCRVHEDPVEILFLSRLLRSQNYAFFSMAASLPPCGKHPGYAHAQSCTISGQLKLHPRTFTWEACCEN